MDLGVPQQDTGGRTWKICLFCRPKDWLKRSYFNLFNQFKNKAIGLLSQQRFHISR